VDDSVAAGTVDVVLGSDYVGIGQPVTAPADTTVPNSYATDQRTAQDTSCIN
jgi:hypothetical protein